MREKRREKRPIPPVEITCTRAAAFVERAAARSEYLNGRKREQKNKKSAARRRLLVAFAQTVAGAVSNLYLVPRSTVTNIIRRNGFHETFLPDHRSAAIAASL